MKENLLFAGPAGLSTTGVITAKIQI